MGYSPTPSQALAPTAVARLRRRARALPGPRSSARGEEASRSRLGRRGAGRGPGRRRQRPLPFLHEPSSALSEFTGDGKDEGRRVPERVAALHRVVDDPHPGLPVSRLNGGSLELDSSACAARSSGGAGILLGLQRAVEWGATSTPTNERSRCRGFELGCSADAVEEPVPRSAFLGGRGT